MNYTSKQCCFLLLTFYLLCLVTAPMRVLSESPDASKSKAAVDELAALLDKGFVSDGWIRSSIASVSLAKEDAHRASDLLTQSFKAKLRKERAEEMKKEILQHGEFQMPFFTKIFGEQPDGGRSLYISMHGGGGAPARVNDRQWENQKGLYTLDEGVYVAPRGPTDTWNLWHQGHIDPLFERLIQNMVVFHDVNPDRVFLMGYSAGGDGVYQLAPRMADYFAAASMMAGHPNETTPHGLRNLPFSLFMGGKDAAYKRNQIAGEWKVKLDDFQSKDPGAYPHWVKIFPEYGHWMQKEDAVAIPWMHKFNRNKYPDRVVWMQDDVLHDRFYWLRIPKGTGKARTLNIVSRKDQSFHIESSQVEELSILLNDSMLDLDQSVKVLGSDGKTLFEGHAVRSIGTLVESLLERGDPSYLFSSAIKVRL